MFKKLVPIATVALFAAVPFFGHAPEAKAAVCAAGSTAALTTMHTSCSEAETVLEKALLKVPAKEFRVYVRGWWHCSYGLIAGLATLTAERGYGTPHRQVVIFVIE